MDAVVGGARSSDIAESTEPETRATGQPPGQPADCGQSWERRARDWGPPHRGPGRRRHRLRGPLRRSPQTRVVAGVCGGLSEATGIEVTILRIGVVLLALGSGVGILVYGLAWLVVPLEGEDTTILSRAVADRRGLRLVVAVVPFLLFLQVVAGARHIGYLGSISWPLFLVAAAAILISRNASPGERTWLHEDLLPMFHSSAPRRARWSIVLRILLGLAIGVSGLSLLVAGHPASNVLRSIVGTLLAVAAVVVIFGPWWLGLIRDLLAERQARALAEERAQLAAHVHDSVLQTLALIQRSADDPHHVVRLAHAQERELRSWLFDGRPPGTIGDDASTLAAGVEVLQRQIEADHGVTVQTVTVGDAPLTEGLRALLDAAREAMVNAARWSGAPQVSLYAEVDRTAVMLYVRDRGCGFDPDAVGEDHRGIAHSIRARVARFGGSAVIHSAPGAGTEVELCMPRRVPAA